jgi:hypothetical protein
MSNGQKNAVFQQSQSQAGQAWNNYQNSYNDANQGYQSELASPGYTAAEKQAMTQATSGSLAGAFGAAQQRLQDQAARTGNSAGVDSTEEQLAMQQGRQNAQALGALQGQFANARIQGTQNALGGENSLANSSGNQSNQALANAGRMATTPGFWSRVLQSGLQGAASGLGRGIGGGA